MEKPEPLLNMVRHNAPLVSSQTHPPAVKLARIVDLFTAEKRKTASVSKLRPTRVGRSFVNGRSEASSAVEALSTLQASLREHSKLRCKRIRSDAATAKFHCERTRSYAARAKFHCEQARAYLNLQVRLHRRFKYARARSH